MGGYNADVRQYLKEICKNIPCSWNKKRKILAQLEESIKKYAIEITDLDYAAIVARFGTPQQIAASYLEAMDIQELTQNFRVKKRIVGILLAAAMAAVLLWACVVFSAKAKFDVDTEGYFEEQIVDVTRIPDNGRGEN